MAVEPNRIARVLLWVILGLIVMGTIANVMIDHVAPDPEHELARLMRRLDLGHEASLPQWYSSLVLFANAVLAGLVSVVWSRARQPFVPHWRALPILMLCLAIDEGIMVHELFDDTLRAAWHTEGVLYFAWVIPGGAFVLAVAIVFARFVWQLDARTRMLMVTAGVTFVSGAIGMELVAGLVMDAHGSEAAGVYSLAHTASQAVQEALGMVGVLLFLYALLDLLARRAGTLRIRFDTSR